MAALEWDATGKKEYSLGIHKVALFVSDPSTESGYAAGVAWNGVSAVNEAPSGAEATDIYANDAKYGSFRSAEQFGFTIEAYTSPEEFDVCDGAARIGNGVVVRQQTRRPFGLAYMNTIGNDTEGMDYSEVLHLVYNATASPSSVNHQTVNESPDVSPLSWECNTTSVNVPGFKPTSHFEFTKDEMDPTLWNGLLAKVYGSANSDPELPTPEDIVETYGDQYTYDDMETKPLDWDNAYYIKYYTKYGDVYSLIPRQDRVPEFVPYQYYQRVTS
jgi:hypothetical protein